MATIVKDHTFVDGKPARPSQANANFDKLFAEINGNLDWENIKAALVNAANGILKLNASGQIELDQVPDTLTGKDADTLDSKHYADIATEIATEIAAIAAEIDEDIATHKADASAHHAKTTDHGELTGKGDDDHAQYMLKAPGYKSGWDYIEENRTFTHSLGSTWLLFTIYVSCNSDGSNAWLWLPHSQYDETQGRLLIVDNDNIRIYNEEDEGRYFKVFIWKIPE